MINDIDMANIVFAQREANFSLDPSTQVGAVLVTPDGSHFYGCNNPVYSITRDDLAHMSREDRMAVMLHAEESVLLELGAAARGGTLYVWPAPCCASCARLVAASGVKRVVSIEARTDENKARFERWGVTKGIEILQAAGVLVELA